MFRASRNKTHVGFRLSQEEADSLAAAAHDEDKTPGAFAKKAVLERVEGGLQQQLLIEMRSTRKELLARIAAQDKELEELREELLAFRTEFVKALPES